MALKGSKSKAVTTYWMQHYITYTTNPMMKMKISICGLCGNTGIIDTRDSAKDAWGNPVGVRDWCVCPNGQTWRSQSKGSPPK